jgi:hypothetical protein
MCRDLSVYVGPGFGKSFRFSMARIGSERARKRQTHGSVPFSTLGTLNGVEKCENLCGSSLSCYSRPSGHSMPTRILSPPVSRAPVSLVASCRLRPTCRIPHPPPLTSHLRARYQSRWIFPAPIVSRTRTAGLRFKYPALPRYSQSGTTPPVPSSPPSYHYVPYAASSTRHPNLGCWHSPPSPSPPRSRVLSRSCWLGSA